MNGIYYLYVYLWHVNPSYFILHCQLYFFWNCNESVEFLNYFYTLSLIRLCTRFEDWSCNLKGWISKLCTVKLGFKDIWSPQKSSLKSKFPYFKHLIKVPYKVYLMKNQRKMAHFVGINTFIDKKYQLYGIKELVISKKFLKANLFLI